MASFEQLIEPNEVTWAKGRMPNRIYISKSFPLKYSRDEGHPGRYIYKVFDESPELEADDETFEWETFVVSTSPGGRTQVQLQVARTAGVVREIRIQKLTTTANSEKLETHLTLDREQSTSLIDLIKCLDSIPIEGETSVRVDDRILRDVFSDPNAVGRIYQQDPNRLRTLIESDASAEDVIALAHRRAVVDQMEEWLTDEQSFAEASEEAGGPERAWQVLFERDPWILGVGLGGHLFTSWDEDRLEQVTTGADITTGGKRVDALLRTSGLVRSMVFAEIKHHNTALFTENTYRSSAWRPSPELSGALVQVQQTVHKAARTLGTFIQDKASDGSRLPTGTYIVQPRSFLIIGSLKQLHGAGGGANDDKVHSFELFRSNIVSPEIITFDELLAKAKWNVELAENHNQEEPRYTSIDTTTGEIT